MKLRIRHRHAALEMRLRQGKAIIPQTVSRLRRQGRRCRWLQGKQGRKKISHERASHSPNRRLASRHIDDDATSMTAQRACKQFRARANANKNGAPIARRNNTTG
jgi:hypothetical protein